MNNLFLNIMLFENVIFVYKVLYTFTSIRSAPSPRIRKRSTHFLRKLRKNSMYTCKHIISIQFIHYECTYIYIELLLSCCFCYSCIFHYLISFITCGELEGRMIAAGYSQSGAASTGRRVENVCYNIMGYAMHAKWKVRSLY